MKSVLKRSRPQPESNAMLDRLHYFESRQDALLKTIREFVEIESPSDDKSSTDRIGAFFAERFAKMGGRTQVHRAEKYGDNHQIDFSGAGHHKPVLLLGHFDTVYSLGTLAAMPCHVDNGRLYGPGVLDMKAGVALMLFAIEGLQAWHGQLPRPVTVFLVSDEEVGSYSSRKITEDLARESGAVLVLEPAAGVRGAVKTARKGVGDYTLTIKGVAAHAGLDPGKGHSAILELARQIAVRIRSAKQAVGLDRKMRSLTPFDRHCQLAIEGGINRMPMERNPGVAALYKKAKALARQIQWRLEEAAVGGGSDGNFTAAIGIPTLDGMGGVGQGAHALHEHIVIAELPRRAMLLAGLIERA